MSRLNATLGTNLDALRRASAFCPDPPPCPACGGLTCFCRPRFFAGQILTESDLNQLEKYVVDKHRLHNRYLHGWGVVCGLKVSINPCGDRVTVGSGYALSPCGDDIIVPEDDTAPICELIRKCRPVRSDPFDCSSLSTREGDRELDREEDFVEEWVLAICYEERPARGVMPLRSGTSTSGCSCGGSSAAGCNCGCGGSRTSTSRSNCAGPTPAAAAACEPTLTCEGYTFTVYKAPVSRLSTLRKIGTDDENVLQQPVVGGRISEKIRASIRTMLEYIPQAPNGDSSTATQQEWFSSVKQGLFDLLTSIPTTDARRTERLAAIKFPDPKSEDFKSQFETTLGSVAQVFAETIRESICDALMPPCPPPADCNCVPMATIKVRRRDCRVLSVCNWTGRKRVLTFPDIIDWLEGSELFRLVAIAIEILCCRRDLVLRKLTLLSTTTDTANVASAPAASTSPAGATPPTPTTTQPAASTAPATPAPSSPTSKNSTATQPTSTAPAATQPTSTAPAATQPSSALSSVGSTASPLSQLLSQSWVNRDTRVIDATTLAGAYLGLGDENGSALAQPFETANPGPFLAVNQMLRPTIEGILPTELSQLMSELAIARLRDSTTRTSSSAQPATTPPPDDLAALRQAVAELQGTVKAQADEIAKLKKP